jgi:hypothetical protein
MSVEIIPPPSPSTLDYVRAAACVTGLAAWYGSWPLFLKIPEPWTMPAIAASSVLAALVSPYLIPPMHRSAMIIKPYRSIFARAERAAYRFGPFMPAIG